MRTGVVISLSLADHARPAEVVADRNSPQKHVWRVRIVLLSAQGVGANEIMRATGKAKTCVWRWQERFMQAGVDGLLSSRCRQRHRHQGFIRFLNATGAEVPAAKQVHAVLDNDATHKHPKVVEWLGRPPRFTLHVTPTSAFRRKPPVSPGSTPSRASSPS